MVRATLKFFNMMKNLAVKFKNWLVNIFKKFVGFFKRIPGIVKGPIERLMNGKFKLLFRRMFMKVMKGFTWADFKLVIRMFKKDFWIQLNHFLRFMFSSRIVKAVKSSSGDKQLAWAAGQCKSFAHIINLGGRIISKIKPPISWTVGKPLVLGGKIMGFGCRIIG